MSDFDLSKYKHCYQIRVRNFEVDSQGIVHNAIYLEYCETARVEYARNLGVQLLPTTVKNAEIKINVKRNEINYEAPATVDELLNVWTRISYIKNSSFCFEHLITDEKNKKLYITQKSVQVNLNPQTSRPERLPGNIRNLITSYEANNVELIN